MNKRNRKRKWKRNDKGKPMMAFLYLFNEATGNWDRARNIPEDFQKCRLSVYLTKEGERSAVAAELQFVEEPTEKVTYDLTGPRSARGGHFLEPTT